MKVIHGSNRWKNRKISLAVGLGNFDGVHRGHQAILKDLVRKARAKGWKTAVYTFDPHPTKILSPQSAPLLIQTLEQKFQALKNFDIDFVIVERFDRRFSKQKPLDFFNDILVQQLNAKGIWVGYDFTFGHKRAGTVQTLQKLCKQIGIFLKIVEPQFFGGTLVNSSQIRRLVLERKVDVAQKLLGRPFALTGKVVKGHGIGGKLGIHTANVKVENELLPKNGIYITNTTIPRMKTYPSATSVGFNPTFPGKGFSVETHLIGFKGNLRGKKIEVAFLKWMREELTFPNAETLAAQIRKDIQEAKKFHATLRHYR